jgi:hypothetical protein
MSDFLVNVLNRHIGIGKLVRPRIRTRFEPDAPVNSMPKYASDKAETNSDIHRGGQDSYNYATSAIIAPADEPATSNMDTHRYEKQQVRDQREPIVKSAGSNERDVARKTKYNPPSGSVSRPGYMVPPDVTKDKDTMEDCNSKKHQVNNQHVPVVRLAEAIENKIVQNTPDNSHPEPVGRSEYVLPADVDGDTDKRKVITSNHTTVDNSRQESVRLHENVHEDINTACEYDMEKSLDNQMQKTMTRLVSPHKHRNVVNTAKADNTAANPNNEAPYDPPSDQYQSTKSGLPSGLSANSTSPERDIISAKPRMVYLQNESVRPKNLLLNPRWLSDRQNKSRKDSRTEIEPITNVTIGRIEVRATPLQEIEKPKRKRKPSGVMSLDQYLSQRNQKGNR